MVIPDILPPRLNTNTSLGKALVTMFRSVQAELVLEGARPGAVCIIIFGGCAVHLYTSYRVSTDVDGEIIIAEVPATFDLRTLLAEVPESFVDDRSGRVMELNYDLQFNTTLGPTQEDYVDRGVRLAEFPDDSPLHVLIAAPVDIAISKLNRGTDQDLNDIRALLRTGFIDATQFEHLALQAIDVYVGNHEPPRTNLYNILREYLEP